MKKIILIILLSSNFLFSYGQKKVYKSYEDLKRYEGTWQYEHNAYKFSVNIYSVTKETRRHNLMSSLEGNYVIVNNGQTVFESKDNPLLISGNYPFSAKGVDSSQIVFFFKDKVTDKSGRAFVKFVKGKTDEIFWWVQNTEGIHVNIKGQKKFDPTFGVPTNIRMKKIQ